MGTARLQLRWQEAPADIIMKFGQAWICHYELVLPLIGHDLHTKSYDGAKIQKEIVVCIGESEIRVAVARPCQESTGYVFDVPFRAGAHAMWDFDALKSLEEVAVAPDGTVVASPAPEIDDDAAALKRRAIDRLVTILSKKLRYDPWRFLNLLKRAGWPDMAEEMVAALGAPMPPPRKKPTAHQPSFDFGSDDLVDAD